MLLPAIILPRLRTGHIFEACEICGCQTGGSVSLPEGCTNCWQCCWMGSACFLFSEKGKHHEELSQAGSLPFDGKGNVNASISYFQKETTHLQAMEKKLQQFAAMQIQALDSTSGSGKNIRKDAVCSHFWRVQMLRECYTVAQNLCFLAGWDACFLLQPRVVYTYKCPPIQFGRCLHLSHLFSVRYRQEYTRIT